MAPGAPPSASAGLPVRPKAPLRALRLAALLLTLGVVVGAGGLLAGCGGTRGVATNPTAAKLQREDLVAIARGLRRAEGSAEREMDAARIAWPLVANGLPATSIPPATRTALANAA